MSYLADTEAIATWEREPSRSRSTGTRRELPAVCYRCGEDVPETPRFGNEAICDECQRSGRVEPWLADRETR